MTGVEMVKASRVHMRHYNGSKRDNCLRNAAASSNGSCIIRLASAYYNFYAGSITSFSQIARPRYMKAAVDAYANWVQRGTCYDISGTQYFYGVFHLMGCGRLLCSFWVARRHSCRAPSSSGNYFMTLKVVAESSKKKMIDSLYYIV
jgi:hypothetical protein